MVRLNVDTWITATTYGSVFSHISQTGDLIRVYLDNEATESLCSDCPDSVINQIEEKQVDVTGFFNAQQRFCQENENCDFLAQKNNWELFSLTPLQISVQTLNYCNAHCNFCYANAPNTSNRNYMNLLPIYKLKDYAACHGVKFGVSGGEPLLHPDIYEILSYRHMDVFDTLITNLTAPVDLDRLIKTNVDLIQVSLHGYDIIHDRVLKINGAYNRIFNRMKYLFPFLNLATNTVITPENLESIPRLVQDFHDFQKDFEKSLAYIRFVPVVPSGTGISTYSVEERFFDKVEQLLRSLQKQFKSLNFEIPMIHANPYEYKRLENNRWMCPAGSTVAVIRLDGHVVPCNQFLDTPMASEKSITESSFDQIWFHDPLFSSLRRGVAATKQKRCDECMYLIISEHK